jgi:acylphosphatase
LQKIFSNFEHVSEEAEAAKRDRADEFEHALGGWVSINLRDGTWLVAATKLDHALELFVNACKWNAPAMGLTFQASNRSKSHQKRTSEKNCDEIQEVKKSKMVA